MTKSIKTARILTYIFGIATFGTLIAAASVMETMDNILVEDILMYTFVGLLFAYLISVGFYIHYLKQALKQSTDTVMPKQPIRIDHSLQPKQTRKCSFCDTELNEDDLYCPNCGLHSH